MIRQIADNTLRALGFQSEIKLKRIAVYNLQRCPANHLQLLHNFYAALIHFYNREAMRIRFQNSAG